MPILHVRNVPETLCANLQLRAETQRRSLSAKVIPFLEWAVVEAERTSEAILASIHQRRSFDPATAGAPDSTTLLRQDRGRQASISVPHPRSQRAEATSGLV